MTSSLGVVCFTDDRIIWESPVVIPIANHLASQACLDQLIKAT